MRGQRSYAEFSKRMAAITTVACPHCGTPLPCNRDEDQQARLSHYARCNGKPEPVEATVIIGGEIDYTVLSDTTLKDLSQTMQTRLIPYNPERRLYGVSAILQPAYKSIFDAAQAELSRRKGDQRNG